MAKKKRKIDLSALLLGPDNRCECGTTVDPKDTACPNCGMKVQIPVSPFSWKRKSKRAKAKRP